jgi:hypothetical protein
MEDEKVSSKKQWQERSDKPIASREMSSEEIEHFKMLLIRSYKCNPDDISYEFEKIKDVNDEDRNDCLLLIYRMKCVVAGKPTIRDIYTKKLPIPDDIKRRAEQIKRQQQAENPDRPKVQRNQANPTPETASQPKVEIPEETPAAKPRVRKAVLRPPKA